MRQRQRSFWIYSYRRGSNSARALADGLDGKIIRQEGSYFRPRAWKTVINWGSCHCPEAYGALNPSIKTRVTRNKLETFRSFSRLELGEGAPRVPGWTESAVEALERLQRPVSEGGWAGVVCRSVLNGQGGSGIQIFTWDKDTGQLIITHKTMEEGTVYSAIPQVPLYVEYVPKDAEYRVHCFKFREGIEAIDIQRKIRDPEREPTDWRVRSHVNGFIFVRKGVVPDGDVLTQAQKAMTVSGLDFAGVDVIWNAKRGKAYVLELNSAVGLEGTTVEKYKSALLRLSA